MRANHTVLEHDPESGELIGVKWNGDDRAVVGGEQFGGSSKMDEWYEALRVWEGILRSDEMQLWSEMKMGTAISKLFFSLPLFLCAFKLMREENM